MFNAVCQGGRRFSQSGRKVIAYGPAMLAGFAGAAAAASTVAYADTIIEIIHGGSKLTI